MGDRVRAFMAILLPAELIERARQVQDQVRPLFPAGSVKWVAPENFHLTLRFYGDLDRKQLGKADGVVADLDGTFGAVPARLGIVSAFPSPARPQTLWVAVEAVAGPADAAGPVAGSNGLDLLAAEVDRRIREAGFGPPDKPWKSHLTLGRVGRDRTVRVDRDWAAGLTCDPGISTITTVALMQSELRPQGPRYTPLRIASASS